MDQDVIFLEFLVITAARRGACASPCNNPGHPALSGQTSAMNTARTKMLVWTVLSVLAAAMTYLIFRGYLSPDLLLGFANSFVC